ncbi:YbaB/EbfC family nucleoid-associated protein [Amycolatopsis jiangsuensis]|uniref:DNA-binding protein YbaB n=1 Tax=Amycolatopsis jiangsuensis TaxID=1181879 RepID=A0A840J389_9PSEU|nr:YbaB/EbfC family nucleoid-associated protein [Amycolatopsis jiangsuensis]MBB4687764.1 DNA-binding protein YbaB [Amycolatopsis jiangsuensis]
MGSAATPDPHDLKRRLAESIERAGQRVRVLAEDEHTTSVITAEAETADGAVHATVTGSGRLHELTLDERVRHWAPEEIAHQVVRCVQHAQSRLAQAAVDAVAPDLPFAALAADRLRAGFPPPEGETVSTTGDRTGNDVVVKLTAWDQDD